MPAFIHKKSSTASDVPSTSQLSLGEIAINTYDGKIFTLKDVSGTQSIVEIGPAEEGDISGVTAGAGLTGGGTTGTVTLDVGAGTGIAVNANDIAVDGVLEDLDTLGASASDGQFIVATGSGAFAYESTSTARTSLGLGTGAVLDTAAIADGGTGLATADQIHTFATSTGWTLHADNYTDTTTNTQNTYTSSWVDSSADALLRLTGGGATSGTQDIKIVAGTGISVTPSGADLTITNTISETVPTTITVASTTDSSCRVALFESATGNLAPKTDGGLLYDATDNKLSIGTSGGYLQNSAGTLNLAAASTGYTIYFRGDETSKFRMGLGDGSGDPYNYYFYPTTDNSAHLGRSDKRWKRCYTAAINTSGDLTFDADGGQFNFNDDTATHFLLDCDNTKFVIYDDTDVGDLFSIQIAANGVSTLSTVNGGDVNSAHMTLSPQGLFSINATAQYTTIETSPTARTMVRISILHFTIIISKTNTSGSTRCGSTHRHNMYICTNRCHCSYFTCVFFKLNFCTASWTNFDTLGFSDQNVKNSISNFNTGLSLINQLQPKNYKYNEDYRIAYHLEEENRVGMIAQDLQSISDNYVKLSSTRLGRVEIEPGIDDSEKYLRPSELYEQELQGALINAIKELSTKNDALEARLAILEAA